MKRPKMNATSHAYWLREYIWRAHWMLGAALTGKSGGASGWLPVPDASERRRYEGLRRAAKKLVGIIDKYEESSDDTAIAAMLQYGMLLRVADRWNERRAEPLWKMFRAQGDVIRGNREKENSKRKHDADERIIAAFSSWQRRARGALWLDGKPLPARRRAELFARVSTYRPRSTQRRRLFALAEANRLPEPPAV